MKNKLIILKNRILTLPHQIWCWRNARIKYKRWDLVVWTPQNDRAGKSVRYFIGVIEEVIDNRHHPYTPQYVIQPVASATAKGHDPANGFYEDVKIWQNEIIYKLNK